MPRFYNLTIMQPGAAAGSQPFRQWTTNPQSGNVGSPSTPNTQQTVYDPAALNIIFDLPISPYHTPNGSGTITLEGVALSDLQQAQQFAAPAPGQGMTLQLDAG